MPNDLHCSPVSATSDCMINSLSLCEVTLQEVDACKLFAEQTHSAVLQ